MEASGRLQEAASEASLWFADSTAVTEGCGNARHSMEPGPKSIRKKSAKKKAEIENC